MANPNPSPATRFTQDNQPEEHLSPLAQLRRMQRVLFDDCVDPECRKDIRSKNAQAWERLEARKAAMTMQPAPKAVDTLELRKQEAKERERREASASNGDGWKPKRKAKVKEPMPADQAQVPQVPEPQSDPSDQGEPPLGGGMLTPPPTGG